MLRPTSSSREKYYHCSFGGPTCHWHYVQLDIFLEQLISCIGRFKHIAVLYSVILCFYLFMEASLFVQSHVVMSTSESCDFLCIFQVTDSTSMITLAQLDSGSRRQKYHLVNFSQDDLAIRCYSKCTSTLEQISHNIFVQGFIRVWNFLTPENLEIKYGCYCFCHSRSCLLEH